jgi:hypothetical protein
LRSEPGLSLSPWSKESESEFNQTTLKLQGRAEAPLLFGQLGRHHGWKVQPFLLIYYLAERAQWNFLQHLLMLAYPGVVSRRDGNSARIFLLAVVTLTTVGQGDFASLSAEDVRRHKEHSTWRALKPSQTLKPQEGYFKGDSAHLRKIDVIAEGKLADKEPVQPDLVLKSKTG